MKKYIFGTIIFIASVSLIIAENQPGKGLSNNKTELRTEKQQVQQAKAQSQVKAGRISQSIKANMDSVIILGNRITEQQISIDSLGADISNLNTDIDSLGVRLDELTEQLNDKMSKYGKAMTFLQRSMSIQEKLMFIFASDNLSQMFRRIRYIREYSSFQKAQGMLIKGEQAEVRNTQNSLLDAKERLLTSQYMLKKTQDDLAATKANCEKKVDFLNRNLNEVKAEISVYERREAAIDAQINKIIQQEIAAEQRRQQELARRQAAAEAAKKAAAERARAAEAARQKAAAEAARRAAAAKAEAAARAKKEAEERAAAARRKAEQDALNRRQAAEARKKAEQERKEAEARARKAKSEAERAEAARKAAEAKRKAEEAKRQEELAKKREAEAKAAQEAARRKAEEEAKEARERAREAERTRQEAAKREREVVKTNPTITSGADDATRQFEAHKGGMPLPVSGGVIVGHYGKYNVAGASNVTLDNKGIDIKGGAGCAAKACYAGTVSSIFQYAGRYIVMVRHGKYISVYSGLSSVSVSNGSKVSTGQTLGTVGSDENGNYVLHFQLRKESSRLNPEQWVR